MRTKLLVVTAGALSTMALAPSAHAFTRAPVWKCRASAVYTSVAGQNRVEPVVANGNINTGGGASPDRAQCAPGEAGAGNTATQLGIPQNSLGAATASAVTSITPELGPAASQKVTSSAKIENLTLQLPAGGTVALGIGVASAQAAGSCSGGNPQPSGTSNVANLTLGGTPITLDGAVQALSTALAPLGQIVQIVPNERALENGSAVYRALHIKILQRSNNSPVVDVVVAEARVGINGAVCSDTGGDNPGGGGNNPIGQVCPAGSVLDQATTLCVIRAGSNGSSLGQIVVGRPFQGPSGGTVVPLDVARKRYGRSPCLGGSGAPKFAIVGTNKADRITGSNIADRIIGLGGNDKLDGGRGNDCIEGRTGGDNMSGALGNDRIFGASGNDHINGGPGTDRLSAGSGNDSINAAFGKDRALGGDGRDFINIATAGPAASADCGKGRDKVRVNRNERKKTKGCETRYVFNDR